MLIVDHSKDRLMVDHGAGAGMAGYGPYYVDAKTHLHIVAQNGVMFPKHSPKQPMLIVDHFCF